MRSPASYDILCQYITTLIEAGDLANEISQKKLIVLRTRGVKKNQEG